jgi:hypothetical protein
MLALPLENTLVTLRFGSVAFPFLAASHPKTRLRSPLNFILLDGAERRTHVNDFLLCSQIF